MSKRGRGRREKWEEGKEVEEEREEQVKDKGGDNDQINDTNSWQEFSTKDDSWISYRAFQACVCLNLSSSNSDTVTVLKVFKRINMCNCFANEILAVSTYQPTCALSSPYVNHEPLENKRKEILVAPSNKSTCITEKGISTCLSHSKFKPHHFE